MITMQVHQRRYVVGLIFDREFNQVALIRKTHPPEQAGLLNGCGGRIELGESPIQAMVRDAYEETGFVSNKDDWYQFHYERHVSGTCLYFYATDISQKYSETTLEDLLVSKTDEKVEVAYYSDYGVLREPKLMYNIGWLVPMALCYLNNPKHRYLEG